MLKETFIELAGKYTNSSLRCHELWLEIETHYQNRERHYHTLTHLGNMLEALQPVKERIAGWDMVLFALFYHDIIYNVIRKDNEEKSAVFAAKRLQSISVPAAAIQSCTMKIEATKNHAPGPDDDTDYFTDADLVVLGQEWPVYADYCKRIRKEYAVYPDIIYYPGRKKVLQHFLKMERIYKTAYFFANFEKQAKQNLQRELEQL